MPLERNANPGDLYLKDGHVWRVVGYQANPTVILERLIGPNEIGCGEVRETHAVGCLNAEPFIRVKPAEEP